MRTGETSWELPAGALLGHGGPSLGLTAEEGAEGNTWQSLEGEDTWHSTLGDD